MIDQEFDASDAGDGTYGDEPKPARRKDTLCRGCQYPVTWREQRIQYGRSIRRGLTPEQAKAIMPRCSKCTTIALREGER